MTKPSWSRWRCTCPHLQRVRSRKTRSTMVFFPVVCEFSQTLQCLLCMSFLCHKTSGVFGPIVEQPISQPIFSINSHSFSSCVTYGSHRSVCTRQQRKNICPESGTSGSTAWAEDARTLSRGCIHVLAVVCRVHGPIFGTRVARALPVHKVLNLSSWWNREPWFGVRSNQVREREREGEKEVLTM